jgi:hypothetical protein
MIYQQKQPKNDPEFITKENIHEINSYNLTCLGCNTLFKLARARKDGLKRFEVDLISIGFGLFIGKNHNKMIDLETEAYLNELIKDFTFLYMHIRNLTEANIFSISNLLNSLDSKFNLRCRVILGNEKTITMS